MLTGGIKFVKNQHDQVLEACCNTDEDVSGIRYVKFT